MCHLRSVSGYRDDETEVLRRRVAELEARLAEAEEEGGAAARAIEALEAECAATHDRADALQADRNRLRDRYLLRKRAQSTIPKWMALGALGLAVAAAYGGFTGNADAAGILLAFAFCLFLAAYLVDRMLAPFEALTVERGDREASARVRVAEPDTEQALVDAPAEERRRARQTKHRSNR